MKIVLLGIDGVVITILEVPSFDERPAVALWHDRIFIAQTDSFHHVPNELTFVETSFVRLELPAGVAL